MDFFLFFCDFTENVEKSHRYEDEEKKVNIEECE